MQKIIVIFLLISPFASLAQNRLLKGKIIDSLQQPLEFANLMAKPLNNDTPFVFAVTGNDGSFEMKLENKTFYSVTVSYMGYKPYTFTVDSLEKPIYKKIQLKPNQQDLDEIVINYQTPVKITQDSIVYNVKYFVKGDEHKLKAVLNKLPGVKVDKNGQITVMGKQITKVMVEGKDFFGGNSKLAVDNIPADAVKSIQVLKDYNRIGFMKGLNDEQKTIINIKLKQGKKRFVFGDLLAGGNPEKKYIAKANLFYYSPHTNLSYIGNLNNTGEASLSFQDISRFESSQTLFSSGLKFDDNRKNLIKFTNADNFIAKNTLFNALQWQQDMGAKSSFEMYSIYADDEITEEKRFENQYLLEQSLLQIRTDKVKSNNQTGITKVKWVFEPSSNKYYDLSISINKIYLNNYNHVDNQLESQVNIFTNYLKTDNLNYTQVLSYYNKLSKKHIIRFFSDYRYQNTQPDESWSSDKMFLNNYIDWQAASMYFLEQKKYFIQNIWNNLAKYYFKVNSKNHFYFSLGDNYIKSTFKSELIQKKENENITISDFSNNYQLKINDAYAGVQYRFKIGKQMFTPGIYLHYLIHINSKQDNIYRKSLLLPELNYEGGLWYGEMSLKYGLKTNLPATQLFAQNKLLHSFDRIYYGNPDLTYEIFHHLSIHYSYFSLQKGIMFFSHIEGKKYLSSLKYIQKIELAEYYNKPFINTKPEYNFSLMTRFEKEWRRWYLEINSMVANDKNYDYINGNWIVNHGTIFENTLSAGTDYDKLPEVEVGINWEYMLQNNIFDDSKFEAWEPYINFQYTYKGFRFKTDYKLQLINDLQTYKKTSELINVSLFYRSEDKPFGIEFSIQNLLGQKYKYWYNSSGYLITHKYIFTLPRIMLLKLHYKL